VEADRPHSREELAGLLWPDYAEASARANLRSVLANVRGVLDDRNAAPPFLAIVGETVQYNRAGDQHVDVAVFKREAAGMYNGGRYDGQAVDELEAAVAQVRGPFMAGFSLPDSPPFEEWVLLRREYFGRQVAAALKHLAGHWLAQDALAPALAYAERWAALEPWQEEAHQQVMRILAQSGRRSDALKYFETCRRILNMELGLEPGEETTALADRIRRGAADGPGQGPRRHLTSRHLPLTPLVGREAEIIRLSALLSDPQQRLVTITGPGGIGKTHLALAVAGELRGQFADGAAVALLAPLLFPDEMVTALAEAVGVQFYASAPPDQQLLDYLAGKQLLLVVDNCEHVLAGRSLLTRLLAAAPQLKLLATSRVRLGIHGEQLFPLGGLAFPSAQAVQGAGEPVSETSHAAVALFVQSVRRLRPDFVRPPGHADLHDIAHICALLHGMPLGILLAATWMQILSPREIAREIEQNFQFLQAAGDGLPARHQSLEIVFRHSWRLLTTAEQAAFRRIAVFRGGFTREAAAVVAEAELPQLLGLAGKHFLDVIQADQGVAAARYTVHELMRQFAAHELSLLPADEHATRQRHCVFYLALLGRRGEELKGSHQMEALAALEADASNVRVAWQWAVEEQLHAQLAQALDGLGLFYQWRGLYQEGEAACHHAAQSVAGTASVQGLLLLANLLRWQAHFSRHLDRSPVAKELAHRSLDLLDSPALADDDVRSLRAAAVLQLGELTPNYTEAWGHLEFSMALSQSVGDLWGTARACFLLGERLSNTPGFDARAQALLAESLQLFQALDDRRSTIGVLKNMGFVAMLRGQHERGESLLRQSLALARALPDNIEIIQCMHVLGHGIMFCGKYAEACAIAEEELLRCQELGYRPMLVHALGLSGMAHQASGNYTQACDHVLLGIQLAEEVEDPRLSSYLLWRLGEIYLAQGHYAEARQLLDNSVELHRDIRYQARLRDVLTSTGYCAYARGESHELRLCLVETLQLSVADRGWFTAIRALPLAALYAASRGQIESAVELYALASCAPYIANSPWFEDVAGRHVAAAATSLPAATVASAQQRGRNSDMWQAIGNLLETLLDEAA
jgi:predicted ATPase/DNA-binding SARP family transcriptional activator